ncbi:MAG: hypothetical protein ACM3YO_01220 [Bacteroidota bacterium]
MNRLHSAFISMVVCTAAAGCGAAPSSATAPDALPAIPGLVGVAANAFAPSLAKIGDRYYLAYESSLEKDSNFYLSTSTDALHWSSAPVAPGQAPCLFPLGGKPAVAFDAGAGTIRIACEGTVSDATGLPEWSCNPAVIPLRQGGYAIAYDRLGGGCEVAKSSDGIHYEAPVTICDDGYEPALAQEADGDLVIAYTAPNGIARVTEENGTWSSPSLVVENPTATGPAISGETLTYSKKEGAIRSLFQMVAGQETTLVSNGKNCAHPSVLLQNGEHLVALGIRNSDGGQGVYLLANPTSR